MAKKKNRPAKKQADKSPVQEKSVSSKANDDRWIWPLLAVIVIAGGFAVWWTMSIKVPEQKTFVDQGEDNKSYKTFEEGLQEFSPAIQDYLKSILDKEAIEKIEQSQSLGEATVRVNQDILPDYDLGKVNSFLNETVNEIKKSGWGKDRKKFEDLSIENKLNAIGSYLVQDKGFIYSSDIIDFDGTVTKDGETKVKEKSTKEKYPEPYLISNLLLKSEGNCSTMPVAYTMVAQRLGLPVKLVTIADHQFCRFDNGKVRLNIETTNPKAMGVGEKDETYLKFFPHNPGMLRHSTTMKSQSLRESISSMHVTKATYLMKSGANEADLKKAIATSLYFDKNSIYAINNIIEAVKKETELSSQEELLKELTMMGYKTGVILPDPEKVKQVENTISEIIGTHRTVTGTIKSLAQDKKVMNENLQEIDRSTMKSQSTYGANFNQLQTQEQKNDFHRKLFAQQDTLKKKKFSIERTYQEKLTKIRAQMENISDSTSSVLKEDYFLDEKSIGRLKIIEYENRQNYQKLLEL